jgi:hypothetical protein
MDATWHHSDSRHQRATSIRIVRPHCLKKAWEMGSWEWHGMDWILDTRH